MFFNQAEILTLGICFPDGGGSVRHRGGAVGRENTWNGLA